MLTETERHVLRELRERLCMKANETLCGLERGLSEQRSIAELILTLQARAETLDRDIALARSSRDTDIEHIARIDVLLSIGVVTAPELPLREATPLPGGDFAPIPPVTEEEASAGSVPALEFLESLDGPLTFGRMLQSIRKCEETNLSDFAHQLGISPTRLEHIENDEMKVVEWEAVRWAEILGYSKDQFVRLADLTKEV